MQTNNTQMTPYVGGKGELFLTASVYHTVITPAECYRLRVVLRSWFLAYLSQWATEGIHNDTLQDMVIFYEVMQEWLEQAQMYHENASHSK